ncbi:hypothetical protein A3D81_01015 [Candidatus Curtissbacteria bacterium RIFCSPHIGHO2_02_FULL_40_17]|uniref:Glycosyltransferase RgtA/B/C/D-like domain-containing protein n=4 Tax=Bacteria candidate phyla TaxID=1783234 RepID=A0A1F5GHL3_9BACT|nr:MAG: hypothetical protein A3D81_01015 [Candidatus Curtissbacteria bacterium RIFCSPHIGHO2_02_FULL_40_17]OGE04019.1 MAG: hypothetical protein A3F45_02700 [Candidatus Curtissbacteria bacterium RIFCSPHIGHO2_12_FULL_41_17]
MSESIKINLMHFKENFDTRKKNLIAIISIIVVTVLLISLMFPLKNQTAGDDYAYAYSVKKSIETGRLYLSEATTAALVFPVLWAILFSSFLGFSFKTLHISVVFFLPIIAITTYFLLKQFKLKPHLAFFASLFFISVPFIFQYAFTFLTDIPFLTLELLVLLFFVRGLKADKKGDLFLGSIFSALAFLTRQLGLLLPLSVLAAYIVTSRINIISRKYLSILAISVLPALTVILYILVFREGTVNQYIYGKRVSETIHSLLFARSASVGLEAWSRIIYVALEYFWQALGLFSLFAITVIASNFKRYLSKKAIKSLMLALIVFIGLVLLEKIVYMEKTYLGFPLVLYRYESLFPVPWPHIWKYLVMISFLFVTTESLLNLKNLKFTRTAIFLLTSFLLFLGMSAIAIPSHKKYVMSLLPFFLIYICLLSKKLKISGLVAIPVLLFVLIDSLQMTKLRYDTNALAQQKGLEIVGRGIDIDRVLPNLEYTWSLWYTVEDKYAQELKKAGGDKLTVTYPVTPANQDYLIISKENIKYGNLPQKYLFIENSPFTSLFVSSYLLTIKKL